MSRNRSVLSSCAALTLAVSSYGETLASGPVRVEIFEKVTAGTELNLGSLPPTERYTEPAFAFVRTPAKYDASAIPLDRSTPFVLRATFERTMPAGSQSFRLRARGAAFFQVDGKTILTTKAQKPNTTGDDPVPPEAVRDKSPLRPPPYPHQDAVTTFDMAAGSHTFTLVAIIGGKGLSPTPGELAVSFANPGGIERLLGPDGTAHLIDAEWESYVAAAELRHSAADRVRRRAASEGTTAAWQKRHETIREQLSAKPGPVPARRCKQHSGLQ